MPTKKKSSEKAPNKKGTKNTDSVFDAMMVPIGSIHPWEKNPRKNADAVAGVAKSLKEFGWVRPIVANSHPKAKGEIIVDHTARLAALQLKLKTVPVRFVNLEPAKARAAALADNRLGERSLWDYDLLQTLTGEIDESLFDVAGFSHDDFVRLVSGEAGDFLKETTDGEKPPPLQEGDPTARHAVTFHFTLAERKEVFAITGTGEGKEQALLDFIRAKKDR